MLEDEEEEVGNADNDYIETDARKFGNKYFDQIASPYVMLCRTLLLTHLTFYCIGMYSFKPQSLPFMSFN